MNIAERIKSYKLRMLAYWAVMHISRLMRYAYSGSLVMNGLITGLNVWIFTQLYTATYASSGVTQVSGLTVAHIIWLLAFVQSFERATNPSPIRLIDDEIKSGSISYMLSKPYSYMFFHLAAFLGRILPSLAGNLLFGCTAAFVLVGPVKITLPAIVAGLIGLTLGYLLDFFMFFMFALMGFWVEEARAFDWLYSKTKLVFGGVILPVALLPGSLQTIVTLLPFSNLYYSAARLMVDFDYSLFYRTLGIQLAWVAVLGSAAYYMFNKGVSHVTVNGG